MLKIIYNNIQLQSTLKGCHTLKGCILILCFCASFCALNATMVRAKQLDDDLIAQKNGFNFHNVKIIAKNIAQTNYVHQQNNLENALKNIQSKYLTSIKQKEFIWQKEYLPFGIELVVPGFMLQDAIKVFIIDEDSSKKLTLKREMFESDYTGLSNKLPQEFEAGALRILCPSQNSEKYQEIATFIGASFFRGFGRGGRGGVFARSITLNTALPEGEEFPSFTHVWLVKPKTQAKSFIMYALMDSPSMVGAYKIIIHPGTSVIMDVESVFYPRTDMVTPRKIGLAPLASMFFVSKNNTGLNEQDQGDAHSSDGLLYMSAEKLFTFRQLSNPQRLTITNIENNTPKGFGLMQRNIDAKSFKDSAEQFERRASLWVEPQEDWGLGSLELIEIPTRSDKHNNIALFWVPKYFGEHSKKEEISYNYKLYWMPPGANPHLLGKVISTQMFFDENDESICTFWVDFASESLNTLPEHTGLTSVVELAQGVGLLNKRLEKNTHTGGWRLVFSVQLPEPESIVQTLIPARIQQLIRFKAYLKRGENLPDSITEVWQYDLAL